MAYTFFPKDVKELTDPTNQYKISPGIRSKLLEDLSDVLRWFNDNYKGAEHERPLGISNDKNIIKIRNSFKDELTKLHGTNAQIKAELKRKIINSVKKQSGEPMNTTDLAFSYGDGSRGGKGVKNTGLLFEDDVVASFEIWKQGEPYESGQILDRNIEKFIEELVDQYKLTKYSEIKVIPEGAMNKARPLTANAGSMYVGGSGNYNIGSTVTDVTVQGRRPSGIVDKTVYMSLKKGPSVSYFNAGLSTSFLPGFPTASNHQANYRWTSSMQSFAKHLGIDLDMFWDTFVYKQTPTKPIGITKPKFNKTAVEQLLKSAVGHGFHMVHKMDAGPIKHFQATPQYMREASTIKGGLTIWYGGKTSAFSRSVQIEMETAHYRRIQLVIRNKAGAHGPPKDLLANYYYR